jgi:NHS family xanthosine MFS transporter
LGIAFCFIWYWKSGSGVIFLNNVYDVVYGMAFDFFNISGSLLKKQIVKIRSSAQGLFMMMTNVIGAILVGRVGGQLKLFYFEIAKYNGRFGFLCSLRLIINCFCIYVKYKHNPMILKCKSLKDYCKTIIKITKNASGFI